MVEKIIEISSRKLKEVLNKYLICKIKGSDRCKEGKYIASSEPEEILSVGLIQANGKEKVIPAVGYRLKQYASS